MAGRGGEKAEKGSCLQIKKPRRARFDLEAGTRNVKAKKQQEIMVVWPGKLIGRGWSGRQMRARKAGAWFFSVRNETEGRRPILLLQRGFAACLRILSLSSRQGLGSAAFVPVFVLIDGVNT